MVLILQLICDLKMGKCSICKDNNVGKFYLICKLCLKEKIEILAKYSEGKFPTSIDKILPNILINEMKETVRDDFDENLHTLKNKTYTASMALSARIFEGMIRHYYDEEYFSSEDEMDLQQQDGYFSPQNEIIGNLYGMKLNNIQPQLFTFGGIFDEDEPESGVPKTLGGIIIKLEEYLPREAVDEFNKLRKIRNQVMHAEIRYKREQALNYFIRVARVLILTYNGNLT